MTPFPQKVAFVVDALPFLGGAEKVLMAALELFPDAPIYTLIYNRDVFAHTPIAARRVIPSFIDHLPLAHSQYRKYLPLMPFAIQQFDLREYERVFSFSYAVAHGISTHPGQKHLSYTHTPMRYAWRNMGLNGFQKSRNTLLTYLFRPFRTWDLGAIANVESFASASHWIADCVKRIYHRESTVIYPPVDVERFCPAQERGDYYLTVSRLVAHKRIRLLIEAFNQLKLPLLIAGDGPERKKLERLAGPHIQFLGFQPDEKVTSLLNRARAFVCAGEEDFGIANVEAQAAGCPVIAYRKGGVLETIREGETGLFFDEPSTGSLVEAVERFERSAVHFNAAHIAASVQRFNKTRFLREFSAFCNG